MGRYRGPAVKLSRREGLNLTETPKVQRYMERRPYVPGQHGPGRRKKLTDYAVRLREKQKLRFMYGVSEKQFKCLFDEAVRREGGTGEVFLQLLESRLDNVVYRLGIAHTRRQARQFVGHGHITVNNKKVDIPSYRVQVGDQIAVKSKSRNIQFIKDNVEARRSQNPMPWLDFEADTMKGTFSSLPDVEDINTPVNILQIIEYYSR